MKFTYALLLMAFAISCKKEKNNIPPPVTAAPILVKDIVHQNLPSPYYHFQYDSLGRVKRVEFSSGLAMYDVSWQQNRITEMKNTVMVNKDRITYEYDATGKPAVVRIANEAGEIYRRAFLSYDAANRLMELEWEVRLTATGFAKEQELKFSYYPDGNLATLRDERVFIDGVQDAAVYTDRFELYDNKPNVDGFSLIHTTGRHLVLLPGIVLQKNNAGKIIRTGDGTNYRINYIIQYNNKNYPAQKNGEMEITSGPAAGTKLNLGTQLSYYD
jgi:hypothetical protein